MLAQTDLLISDARAKSAAKSKSKEKREAAKAEKERKARLLEMLNEPNKWLRAAEKLADARGTENYESAW